MPIRVPVGYSSLEVFSVTQLSDFSFFNKALTWFSRLRASLTASSSEISNFEESASISSIFLWYSSLLRMTTPLPLSGFIMTVLLSLRRSLRVFSSSCEYKALGRIILAYIFTSLVILYHLVWRCLELKTERYLIKIYWYFNWFYGFTKSYMLGHHIYSENLFCWAFLCRGCSSFHHRSMAILLLRIHPLPEPHWLIYFVGNLSGFIRGFLGFTYIICVRPMELSLLFTVTLEIFYYSLLQM